MSSPIASAKSSKSLRQKAERQALKVKAQQDAIKRANSIQQHESLTLRISQWKDEILPQWKHDPTTPNRKYDDQHIKVKELCRQGIPSNIRDKVWPLLIGNSLELTADTYQSLRLQCELTQVHASTSASNLIQNHLNRENEHENDTLCYENDVIVSDIPPPSSSQKPRSLSATSSSQYQDSYGYYRMRSLSNEKKFRSASSSAVILSPVTSALQEKPDEETLRCLEEDIQEEDEEDEDEGSGQAPSRLAMVSTSLFPMFSGQPETIALIEFDLPRTFPTLGFFHEGGPLQGSIERVLQSYAYFKPEIGYVQGMSYLAAMLLLYMDEVQAFICLANLLQRRGSMDFFALQREAIDHHVVLFDYFFSRQLPLLYKHMKSEGITADMFLLDWHLSLFAKSLPLEVVARIWDVYLCEGEIFLLKVGLGVLRMSAPRLGRLGLEDIMSFLTHLPESTSIDELLRNIDEIKISRKRYENIRRSRTIPPPSDSSTIMSRLSFMPSSSKKPPQHGCFVS